MLCVVLHQKKLSLNPDLISTMSHNKLSDMKLQLFKHRSGSTKSVCLYGLTPEAELYYLLHYR